MGELLGTLYVKSTFKSWKIRRTYHKLPTVTSGVRLEGWGDSKSKREVVRQRDKHLLGVTRNTVTQSTTGAVFNLGNGNCPRMYGRPFPPPLNPGLPRVAVRVLDFIRSPSGALLASLDSGGRFIFLSLSFQSVPRPLS